MNEEIKKVKRVIKNINKICDENNKSLQEVFKDMQVNEVVFLENIGIEKELFDDEVCQDLRTLLNNKDTRFYINNNMESIENDEIELYSKILNKDLGFLKNKIKMTETTKDEKENGEKINYYCKLLNKSLKFILEFTKDDKEVLFNVKINVYFKIDGRNGGYNFNIDKMLKKDLYSILKYLYRFDIIKVYNVLKEYPRYAKNQNLNV